MEILTEIPHLPPENNEKLDGFTDTTKPETDAGVPADSFMAEARRHPLLTAKEEVELAIRYERGDLEAKDKMINSNLRWVAAISRKYLGQGLELGDLRQEGVLGLIRAVEKFDYRKGFKFSTYSYFWIRQAIRRGLDTTSRTIRFSVPHEEKLRKIKSAEGEFKEIFQHEPCIEDLAEMTGISQEEIEELIALPRVTNSLNTPVSDEGKPAELGDFIPANTAEGQPQEEIENAEREKIVGKALLSLPEEQKRIVRMRYGITKSGPQPMHIIAKAFGTTQQKIREAEAEALTALQGNDELKALT